MATAQIEKPAGPPSTAGYPPWRWIVGERIARVEDDIRRIDAQLPGPDAAATADLDAARENLRTAKALSENGRWHLRDRLTRTSCDAAFRHLHAAEAAVTAHLPEPERTVRVRQITFKAEAMLDKHDPLLQEPKEDSERPEHARELVTEFRGATDDMYKQANSYRSRLIVLTIIVTLFVAVLVLAAAAGVFALEVNGDGRLVFGGSPDGDISAQRALAAAAVCTFGAVGGLLAGAGPVSRLGGVYNPSNLPIYSLLLKIQMGALCGLIGVLFVLGEFAPEIDPELFWKDAILWGLVFGAAQQVVTRLVDRRVSAMVSNTPTTQMPSS